MNPFDDLQRPAERSERRIEIAEDEQLETLLRSYREAPDGETPHFLPLDRYLEERERGKRKIGDDA